MSDLRTNDETRASYHALLTVPSFEEEAMTKDHRQRQLAALVVTAFVTATSAAIVAQTPAQQPVEPAAVPAAVVSTPTTVPGKTVGPQFTPTPEQVADSLMGHQRYQAAIEEYKKAPYKSATTWNKMGVAYQLMFNPDEAIRCYQAALKLDAKNAVVMNNLGTIYVSRKEYSKAEKTYRKAVKLDPQSALVHKNMGTVLLAEHKYKKGWQEYQTALSLDPKIFEKNNAVRVENPASVQDRGAMNYYMAKGCVRAGQMERAVEYLRQALNEGFTNPKKLAEDSEFAALRDVPAFQQLLASQEHSQ
jgi:pentatricopeptide repeat protein